MTFLIIVSSFLTMLLLGGLALRAFPRLKLMDRPERYGHERKPIPYPGGIALFLAFIGNAFFFLPVFPEYSPLLISVLTAATLLVLTCFVDDRHGLSPYLRLGVQILCAVILVLGGIGISSITNPFGDPLVLDSIQIPLQWGNWVFILSLFADLLTVVWVVAMINAFNWIDGVSGTVNAVSAVSAFILLMLSMRPDFHYVDQTLAITLSALVLGLSLGFLFFDFPPAKMLMGDTGSMLLGFLIAVTAIISGGKIATTVLVLGFPLLDFLWVITRRLLKGQSPFKGDLWHFHHRLLKAGFSERSVVVLFAFMGALFGTVSLLLHTEGKLLALLILGLMMLTVVSLLYFRLPKRD